MRSGKIKLGSRHENRGDGFALINEGHVTGDGWCSGGAYSKWGKGSGYSDDFGDGDSNDDDESVSILDIRCACGGRLKGNRACVECRAQMTHRQLDLLARNSSTADVALRLGVR